jgi:hypothetical protein
MKSEDVKLGMIVKMRRGAREANLRGRIGIVRERFGNHSYTPFEVQFGDKQPQEILWASEFEEW